MIQSLNPKNRDFLKFHSILDSRIRPFL